MTRFALARHPEPMTTAAPSPRDARPEDIEQLLPLWASLFDQGPPLLDTWVDHAKAWFGRSVDARETAVFPVIDIDGRIVACAIGTLETGVPNPQSPRGRAARLSNVVTLPEHRGRGFGTALVDVVIEWARSIDADRVDLSTTPQGQRIYERAGFRLTSAPRMKLPLEIS